MGKLKTAYAKAVQDAGGAPDEATQATPQQMKEVLEVTELQLQAAGIQAEE